MNTKTMKSSKGPSGRTKYPWAEWLSGTFEKPVVLTFGKEIPAEKSPAVFATQLHQWATLLKKWAYTSVIRAGDKVQVKIYAVPRTKKARPESKFPYPKNERIEPAKQKKPKSKSKSKK